MILGQDPYHGEGQAHGLAFSVPPGVKVPPSLRNIFAELQRDLGCTPPIDGTLEHWARQGVLLLNAVFTVERAQPGSHARKGWETLTSMLLDALAADQHPKVFMLWGAFAQAWHPSIERAAPDAAGKSSVAIVGTPPADSVHRMRTLLAQQRVFCSSTGVERSTGARPAAEPADAEPCQSSLGAAVAQRARFSDRSRA